MARLLILGAGVGTMLGPGAVPVRAEPQTSSFSATASARLVAVDIRTAPAVVFDPLLDGGQSVAQARIDSLGTSRAFAASWYPGTTVLALPGSLATATKGEAGSDQIPRYPLYVDSSDPTKPSDHQTVGAYDLAVDSSPVESRAKATDGATRGVATVRVDGESGDVIARALTTVAAVRVTDQVSVNGVRSSTEVRRSPSGDVKRASAFEVDSLTILGQQVAITADGLSLPGRKVPAGEPLEPTVQPLLAALAAHGTTIELVPSQDLPDGVVTAGLRITTTANALPSLASGLSSVTITFTFGTSAASVSNDALPAISAAVPIGRPGSTPTSTATRAAPAGTATTPRPPEPALPARGAWTPAAPAAAGENPLPAGTAAGASLDDLPVATVLSDVSAAAIYPVLAVAALVLYGTARLFPHLAGTSS